MDHKITHLFCVFTYTYAPFARFFAKIAPIHLDGCCFFLEGDLNIKKLKLMKDGFTLFKGADIAINVFQLGRHLVAVLTYPVSGMGIGTDGNDLSAQLFVQSHIVHTRQVITAAIPSTGIDLNAFAFRDDDLEDLLHDIPMLCQLDQLIGGMSLALTEVG